MRLIITPQVLLIVFKVSTDCFKSLNPNGVGSVTKITKSASATVFINGQEVPGGESKITILSSFASLIAALIIGTGENMPTLVLASTTEVCCVMKKRVTVPNETSFSLIASNLQATVHAPHP